jgi:hypothetical protein
MNKAQRQRIDEMLRKLEPMLEDLEPLKEELSTLASEERDKFDNMPESLQGGEKGQAIDEAATELESASENIAAACAPSACEWGHVGTTQRRESDEHHDDQRHLLRPRGRPRRQRVRRRRQRRRWRG